MRLDEVILRDTRANQPAAATSNSGFIYYVTDENVTERSNGTTWEDISDAGAGAVDSDDVTYTPTTLADWDSAADPGDVEQALDQLAERIADVEGVVGGGGITTVTALPASPADGETVLLRLGSSPYEFIMMTFDATYSNWVSTHPLLITGNGLEAEVTTTSNTPVAGMSILINRYKTYYDAGLRLQVSVAGRYRSTDATGTAKLHAEILGGTLNVTTLSSLGTTTGVTSPSGNANTFLQAVSDWQDFSASDPGSDTQAFIRMILTRGVAGTAGVTLRNMSLRWIAADT
jgi:hypothetical protein